MRKLLPASLALRIFLVLLVGVLLSAVLAFNLAQRDRRAVIEHFHGREAVQRIADMLRLLANLPQAQRNTALSPFNPVEWRLTSTDECSGRPAPHLTQGLTDRLAGTLTIDNASRFDTTEQMPIPPTLAVRGHFADGSEFCLVHKGERRVPPQIEQWRFPVSLGLFVLLIALVSWFAVRLALRPLQHMAAAAEAFGRDIHQPPLDTSGPSEVGQAAQAFNAMQEKVRAFMAERTQILAAVTHDLKTPLTRMRLRLENCNDDPLREKLGNDLAAMQTLIDEGLDLSRSLQSTETGVRIDVGALLSSIADDAADAGQPVQFEEQAQGHPVLADCRPNGLRRAIENLIDNALKYGKTAEISLVTTADSALIRIRDHGPGIPEESLEEVLRPFVRLENSRSRESGGTGLGLAIASNLLAAQGATLTLTNLPEGGLEARIELPIAAA
jgi:signal transduction histidine kinase